MNLRVKVEHINYTMDTCALSDTGIYTLAHGITITYIMFSDI